MTLQSSVQSFQQAISRRRLLTRYAAEVMDLSAAEAAAKKAEKRFEENHKAFKALKKPKGDRSSKDLDVIIKNGNEAVTAAKALISRYEAGDKALKGKAKKNYNAGLDWLATCVDKWRHASSGGGETIRENRIGNTYAGAQQLEAALRGLPASLRGKEEALDDSWRNH